MIEHGFIGKTRTLIIGENYPGISYATTYFYRSIPTCPGGPIKGSLPSRSFFKELCDGLRIPELDVSGKKLDELYRQNVFLNSGFLVIDAQENLVKALRPAKLSPAQIDILMRTILLINPANILFLTEYNKPVISSLKKHAQFHKIESKIVINHLKSREWFCFPSSPYHPGKFKRGIDDAMKYYFL